MTLKIGDVVIWEEWAGPQILVRRYKWRDVAGEIEFAELKPARGSSKNIGHDVPVDDLDWWGFESELTEVDEDGDLKY